MTSLTDRVAVVTGGSKGIGRAIVRHLARQGAHVVALGRHQETLDETRASMAEEGLSIECLVADVALPDAVGRAVQTTVQKFGRIDVLVNNAGMGVFRPVRDMSVEEFDAMWHTNVRGVFLMCRAVLPHMSAGGGDIINIASLAGKNALKGGAGYAATKWALRGFAQSLMLEVRDQNIRVVTIFPGSVDTAFSSMNKRGDKITQPQDVADAVLFAIGTPSRAMVSEIDIRPTNPS